MRSRRRTCERAGRRFTFHHLVRALIPGLLWLVVVFALFGGFLVCFLVLFVCLFVCLLACLLACLFVGFVLFVLSVFSGACCFAVVFRVCWFSLSSEIPVYDSILLSISLKLNETRTLHVASEAPNACSKVFRTS